MMVGVTKPMNKPFLALSCLSSWLPPACYIQKYMKRKKEREGKNIFFCGNDDHYKYMFAYSTLNATLQPK